VAIGNIILIVILIIILIDYDYENEYDCEAGDEAVLLLKQHKRSACRALHGWLYWYIQRYEVDSVGTLGQFFRV
jgi:hypothetical protein